jgi:hypothetical protein
MRQPRFPGRSPGPQGPFAFHLPPGILARVAAGSCPEYRPYGRPWRGRCALCRDPDRDVFGVHFPLTPAGQPDLSRLSDADVYDGPQPAAFCEPCYGNVKRAMRENGAVPASASPNGPR